MTKDNKQEFCERLRKTNREGVENIIALFEEQGFFTAPASTRFHLNYEGGLVEHSLNVCDMALEIRNMLIGRDDTLRELLPEDSVIIASLLHDTCKGDIYKPVMKKQKNQFGVWTDVPGYDVDYSSFPLGHGEKSVIVLLQNGLELTDDEIMAIRWHMNAWDLPFQSPEAKNNYNTAKNLCPLLAHRKQHQARNCSTKQTLEHFFSSNCLVL